MANSTATEYANVPQNDKHQIDQVVQEYESNGHGLAHGVQKDAIQNGFGARKEKNEIKACKGEWKFFFELVKIKSKYALVFWEEGTLGLIGDILSVDQIEQRSNEGLLGAENSEQRLSRFLTRFESGGNVGAGSFGRGKLIFQGASKDYAILIDSLRSSDNKYVALERKIIGNQLKQNRIPFVDEEAKKFIDQQTGGILKPLKKHGTRITILNVNEEIIDAFKKSFEKEATEDPYTTIFSKMIEETWWEIIEFGAQINIKYEKFEKNISLTTPLKEIIQYKDGQEGYEVYKADNVNVVVDEKVHKIKHLKFVVSPYIIDEDLRVIWVQRKRMKIGELRGITPHHKILKYFSGYIILDENLEKLLEQKESTTHYGFEYRGSRKGALNQVKEVVKSQLDIFQKKLGLKVQDNTYKAKEEMLDTLKDLNGLAKELGLPTEFSAGTILKNVEIHIKSFSLPRNTTRVEMGDNIGPIIYEIINRTSKVQFIQAEIITQQRERADNIISKQDFELAANGSIEVPISFNINNDSFTNYQGVMIRARILERNSSQLMSQVTRMLWLGIEPPESPEYLINVKAYTPIFPRLNSRRVELNENIKQIYFQISNNTAEELELNLDLIVRKAKSATSEPRDLTHPIEHRGYKLPPLAERDFAISELNISEEVFGSVFEESINSQERKCEIYFAVRAAKNYPSKNVLIGKHIGPKKTVVFYCGVDPEGMSIFKNIGDNNDTDTGKRSWVEGNKAEGYTFILNVGHTSFKMRDTLGEEFSKYHIREQMLFQAYLIAVGDGYFKGPAEEFEKTFTEDNMSAIDSAIYLDDIVGRALNLTN